MKPTILTIRAVGAEFARRILYPIIIIVGSISLLLAGLGVYLTLQNAWWGLLLFAIISAICIAIAVLTIAFMTVRTVRPLQNPIQRKAVRKFVDKLEQLSEVIGTPKFILLFRIIKDIAAPRTDGFIGSMTGVNMSMKNDYKALVRLFDERYIEG